MGKCSQQLRGLAGAHRCRSALFVCLYFDGTAAVTPFQHDPCLHTSLPLGRDLSWFHQTGLDFHDPSSGGQCPDQSFIAVPMFPFPVPALGCLRDTRGGESEIEPSSGGGHGALG